MKLREGRKTGRNGQTGSQKSHKMLTLRYRTCKDKVKGNLEVIGGAEVSGVKRAFSSWLLVAESEERKQELERKGPALGDRGQIH